jgi:hypothetical protein
MSTAAQKSGENRTKKPSSLPEPRECNIPGKKKYAIGAYEFIIDEAYEVRREGHLVPAGIALQ